MLQTLIGILTDGLVLAFHIKLAHSRRSIFFPTVNIRVRQMVDKRSNQAVASMQLAESRVSKASVFLDSVTLHRGYLLLALAVFYRISKRIQEGQYFSKQQTAGVNRWWIRGSNQIGL
jgi:hypothetical protein